MNRSYTKYIVFNHTLISSLFPYSSFVQCMFASVYIAHILTNFKVVETETMDHIRLHNSLLKELTLQPLSELALELSLRSHSMLELYLQ